MWFIWGGGGGQSSPKHGPSTKPTMVLSLSFKLSLKVLDYFLSLIIMLALDEILLELKVFFCLFIQWYAFLFDFLENLSFFFLDYVLFDYFHPQIYLL